jgi:hypothetical protein
MLPARVGIKRPQVRQIGAKLAQYLLAFCRSGDYTWNGAWKKARLLAGRQP